MAETDANKALMELCPSLTSSYRAPWFLINGHVETIAVALLRKPPAPVYRREPLPMRDGGAVALDWLEGPLVKALPDDAPALVLLPGLTGGSEDGYVIHMALAAARAGIRPVVFNSRGTAHFPVRSPQFYSASYTDDLRAVIKHVGSRFPGAPLLACGWSLGANILVRYLGEEGEAAPLTAAVSLCNPFNLMLSDRTISRGFNRIYDRRLADSLRGILSSHRQIFEQQESPVDLEKALRCKSIREFDVAVTVPTFGWKSVDDYYAGSSSCLSIPSVRVPLLCVQAENDPIAPEAAIPYDEIKRNPRCVLVTTQRGGHLGWVGSEAGGIWGEPWTDKGVIEYLRAALGQRRAVEEEVAVQEAARA